jgi:hypothetical protein
VLDGILRFAQFSIHRPSFDCILTTQPCEYSAKRGFPTHMNLYSAKQIELIWSETEHLMKRFGYTIDFENQRVNLTDPGIPMCL